MAWIKRNLVLVVGVVIALALMGVAIFYLMDKLREDGTASQEFADKAAAFKALLDRAVHPGDKKTDNINAAKEDAKRLQGLLADERQIFGAPITTNRINNKEFRALLDVTIDQLQREAEYAGVSLPITNYWFTFAAQKTSVEFVANTLGPLASQLRDIKMICEVLYRSRVTGITALKRIPITKEDVPGVDYTTYKGVTNELAVITPYEVIFQGFSVELEHVLEGLAKSPEFFIVKNVAVDKVASTPQEPAMPSYNPMMMNPAMRGYGMNPEMARRYGMAPPPQMAPPPGAATAKPRPGKGGLTTVLDENKLKFHLRIDVVRLKAPGAPAK